MTYLVVGASSRRGRAISAALARTGQALVLADASGDALDACVRDAEAAGASVRGIAIVAGGGWATNLVAGAGAPLEAVIFAPADDLLAGGIDIDLDMWEAGFDALARRPWQLAKAVARTGVGTRFLALGSHEELAHPSLGWLAFLLQTVPAGSGIAANLLVGDDADGAAALAAAILGLPMPLLHGQILVADEATTVPSDTTPSPAAPRSTAWPRRVIVTGGAGEIAQALCEALASACVQTPLCVTLIDRDADRLADTAQSLGERGLRVETLVGDMADPGLPARAVALAVERHGGVDAVFSHAGVGLGDPTLDMSDDDFDLSYRVNLRATWLLAQASKAALADSGGSFIATGSVGGLRPGLAPPVYGASKAAVVLLVERLAVAWGPLGIRVNAVSPGSTLTPMNRLWGASGEQRLAAVAGYPLRRMAEPAEVGAAMAFLAGPQASYISGHNLVVDGALSRIVP